MDFDRLPKAEEEGMRGYALRQAALQRALHADFTKQWKAVPSMVRKGQRHPEVSPELVKLTNTVEHHAEGRCESLMSFLEAIAVAGEAIGEGITRHHGCPFTAEAARRRYDIS
jgi:hypothetical protein